jgi:hypothetical protein
MKRIIIYSLLIIVSGWSIETSANDALNGIWIDTEYLQAMQVSHSPRTAFALVDWPILSINLEKHILSWTNYHEMVESRIQAIDPAGNIILQSIDSTGNLISLANPTNIHVFNVSQNTIHMEYTIDNRQVVRAFSKITSETHDIDAVIYPYFEQLVLAGEYTDQSDRQFIFDRHFANLNGHQFSYMIFLDYTEYTPIDAFCEVNAKSLCQKTYGFITNGKTLLIYEYDDDAKTIGKLLHVLQKKR